MNSFKALNVLIATGLFAASAAFGQDIRVSGTVRNAATREALPYANVFIKGGTRGTSTNSNGSFELKLEPGSYELLARCIGFKTESVRLSVETRDLRMDFNLSPTELMLQEVAVYASSGTEDHEVSSISIQSAEMVKISSITSDVFHSIQSLPGIAVNNELDAKFNVRGGNADENLVLVNDTQVYEPFHVKEADNASVGIFNMDLMKKVNLITGGFSAQYGDRLSSVLNIDYREGNRERFTGSATLSMTNLTGVLEGPLSSDGSFILGVRKSYTEYVLSLLEAKEQMKVSFYDVQGVLSYNMSDVDKLQAKFIHAGDDFGHPPNTTGTGNVVQNGWFNNSPAQFIWNETVFQQEKARYFSNLVDVKNSLFLSNDALLTLSVSYYEQIDEEDSYHNDYFRDDFKTNASPDRNYFYDSYYEETYNNNLNIKTLEPKVALDAKLSPFYELKTGFSYLNIHYNQDFVDRTVRTIRQNYERYPDTVTTALDENVNTQPQNTDARSFKLAAYAENVLQVYDNLIVNAGARIDYFDINRDLTVSPRLSASFKIDDGWTLRAAWGHYYQSPIYRQLASSVASDTNTQSQKAEHYILSLERNTMFGADERDLLTVKAEGYYKKYSSLISSTRSPSGEIYYSRRNDSKGSATGADLFLSVRLPWYYGWLSYGLLWAKEDLLADGRGDFSRYTDQRHTLSLVNDFDLGAAWSLNLGFTYGSGFAFTPYYSQYNSQLRRYEWVQGEKNSEHLPAYSRVDLRVATLFNLFGLPASAFLDVSNLLNNTNIYGYRYRYDSNGYAYRRDIELWPILPSLGITVKI